MSARRKRRKYRMAVVDGKRVRVVRLNGVRGYMIQFTTVCSGCTDDRENVTCYVGSGCHECGYTGKCRQRMWMPLKFEDFDKAMRKG